MFHFAFVPLGVVEDVCGGFCCEGCPLGFCAGALCWPDGRLGILIGGTTVF